MTGRSTLRSSIIEQIANNRYFGKASVQDEKFVYLRDKLVLVEMTSLLGRDYSQVGREH
jgi:hypothetical protein